MSKGREYLEAEKGQEISLASGKKKPRTWPENSLTSGRKNARIRQETL